MKYEQAAHAIKKPALTKNIFKESLMESQGEFFGHTWHEISIAQISTI